MSIIRAARKITYTNIDNTIINDPELDWKDLGLLVFLLSKPDSWEISAEHLAKQRKLGRDGIYSGLKAICNAGYASKKPSPKGGWDWTIYDEKIEVEKKLTPPSENPNTENPNTENPNTENPYRDFPIQVNTDYLINTEKAVNTENNSLSPASEETIIFSQELPAQEPAKIIEKELPPPSANRPSVDREIENLAVIDVVNYLAAMAMILPVEEAQAFIDHFSAQGWHTNNGAPIADWKAKARQWYSRYKQYQTQKPNEAAKKPNRTNATTASTGERKPATYVPARNSSMNNESVIDSFAVNQGNVLIGR